MECRGTPSTPRGFSVEKAMAITTSPPAPRARFAGFSRMRRRETIEGILYLSPWIVGFLFFVIFAALYNLLAKSLGGFEVEIKNIE